MHRRVVVVPTSWASVNTSRNACNSLRIVVVVFQGTSKRRDRRVRLTMWAMVVVVVVVPPRRRRLANHAHLRFIFFARSVAPMRMMVMITPNITTTTMKRMRKTPLSIIKATTHSMALPRDPNLIKALVINTQTLRSISSKAYGRHSREVQVPWVHVAWRLRLVRPTRQEAFHQRQDIVAKTLQHRSLHLTLISLIIYRWPPHHRHMVWLALGINMHRRCN
mmetsp:Transcript_17437/g.27286  ORF Transcript_17437/g.27286 Transcript_17437/m.27286 type:complete len:221 (+) Transcript_17437:977-1639(+)